MDKPTGKICGYFRHFGMEDWWTSALTPDERAYLERCYSDRLIATDFSAEPGLQGAIELRIPETTKITLEWIGTGIRPAQTISRLVEYCMEAEHDITRELLVEKVEELDDPLSILLMYHRIISWHYRRREDDPESLDKAIKACQRSIEKIPNRTELTRPAHVHAGFCQLVIIREKRGEYSEAIRLCKMAIAGGWSGKWKAIVERCERRILRDGPRGRNLYAEFRHKPSPTGNGPQLGNTGSPSGAEERVPSFCHHFASVRDMNPLQRQFYYKWCAAWREGTALEVNGQISYLFCHMYGVLEKEPKAIIDELARLKTVYREAPEPFGHYCRRWTSDAYMVAGQYREALGAFPEPTLDGRSASSTDSLLSLRLLLGERIRGRDVVTLNGPRTTEWGRNNLGTVAMFIDALIPKQEERMNSNLLAEWAKTSHTHGYFVFSGSSHSRQLEIPAYSFSRNPMVEDFVRKITREAEDTAREEVGLPRVGEGWVSETTLFYDLKDALPDHEVLQHARPAWLGRQHLDIFFPSLCIAVEFHGLQHDQPVAYFGGEAAFRECQERDELKRKLCRHNGVRLIEVRPGYELRNVVRLILSVAVS